MTRPPLSPEVLRLDPAAEAARLQAAMRTMVFERMRRKGVVLGLSGGIDSSVVAALAVRGLGKERVLGLFMPEADSADESEVLGRRLATSLGIRTVREDIRPILEAAGCYRRRDEAIRNVIPAYGPGYKSKIVLPDVLSREGYAVFSAVVQSPAGEQTRARLTVDSYLETVAATNFKQRTRKMMEYYYADRFQYAVAGTPNRLEYELGFFVKNGDGAADLKPIAHLYKTQVYHLAEYLDIPEEIRRRPPTTDTYSMPQSQEEFFFSLPYDRMDLCLYAKDHGYTPMEASGALQLTEEQVARVYRDIDGKRAAARYLHMRPLMAEPAEGHEQRVQPER